MWLHGLQLQMVGCPQGIHSRVYQGSKYQLCCHEVCHLPFQEVNSRESHIMSDACCLGHECSIQNLQFLWFQDSWGDSQAWCLYGSLFGYADISRQNIATLYSQQQLLQGISHEFATWGLCRALLQVQTLGSSRSFSHPRRSRTF